jgi:hypothetical protein
MAGGSIDWPNIVRETWAMGRQDLCIGGPSRARPEGGLAFFSEPKDSRQFCDRLLGDLVGLRVVVASTGQSATAAGCRG